MQSRAVKIDIQIFIEITMTPYCDGRMVNQFLMLNSL